MTARKASKVTPKYKTKYRVRNWLQPRTHIGEPC